MFRQEALEKLSSPDELDQMLVIVGRKGWISLATGGVLCFILLLWSFFGAIPMTVDGVGILISPGYVKPIQAQTSGAILELRVRPGMKIKAGDIMAVISVPNTQQQLQQARSHKSELERVNSQTIALDSTRIDLELESLNMQARLLSEEIQKAHLLGEELVAQTQRYNATQKQNLEKTKTLSKELAQSFEERYVAATKLKKDGLASEQMVLSARTSLVENKRKLADLDVQMQQLGLSEIRAQQTQLDTQNNLADMRMQLLDLKIRRKKLQQEKLRSSYTLESQVRQASDTENNLALQLDEAMYIRSPYSGKMVEVSVSYGQFVQPMTQMGMIELDGDDKNLRGLAYFPVKDGKKIQQGMALQLTPTIVERERFGSIRSKVLRVSDYPISRAAAATILGSSEMAHALTGSAPVIEVEAELLKDPSKPSGYDWSSRGPKLELTPGTTIQCRVTVERRSPISYVLPIMRNLLAGEE
jgi:HlyD family secretion protein